MSLAIVFPGQGSQKVGMGREWYERYPIARAVFEAADDTLGLPLSRLCFDGPEETLQLTENAQPAILATSWAIYSAVRAELPAPLALAGHSLGEYTALVAAGALSFGAALRLVRERGRLMQQAVPVGAGAMAAVIGLPVETILSINAGISNELGQPVEIANYNSLEQIVVSGAAAAVQAALPMYQAAGAKRVVELKVSAPFHSSLMRPAADALLPLLVATDFATPDTVVLANLEPAAYLTWANTPPGLAPGEAEALELDPAQILHAQIFNSVRWVDVVRNLATLETTHLLEIGPGRVLRSLTPRIEPALKSANIEIPADLPAVLAWLDAGEAQA